MRLVGASNSFIRGPFIMEGIIEALIGSALAIIGLQIGMSVLMPRLAESLQFLTLTIDGSTIAWTYVILLAIGVVIGLFGSAIAMRRYLKV